MNDETFLDALKVWMPRAGVVELAQADYERLLVLAWNAVSGHPSDDAPIYPGVTADEARQ